jgi:C1A family cysteine protease
VNRRPRSLFVGAAALAALAACSLSGGAAVGAAPNWSAEPYRTAAVSAAAAADEPPWSSAGPYPTSFDLRVSGRVSPVRQQENYSTCWIQSAMSSLESSLLPERVYDFSENNLANHMASKLVFEGHGTNRLAAAYFTRWDGPVLERSDPYPREGRSPEGLRAVRHVQDVLFLPERMGPLDNDAVKWAVSAVGGVSCAIAFENTYMDSGTFGYRSTQPGMFLNHYVTVVGWDDRFPASAFLDEPDGDGAFLIKNSWGADWGDAGYFWLSYYDANFGHDMAVFAGAEAPTDYDAVYQHDPLGWSGGMQPGAAGAETAWFAARHRAVGTGSVAAVGFYAPVAGSSFEVRVAPSVGGVAAAAPAAKGTAPVGGYHTVDLTTPVAVREGEVFVVAVRLTAPGCDEPVAVERPSALIAPSSAPGQSYVSPDGTQWIDLAQLPEFAGADVCLKAFVAAAGAGDVKAPTVSVSATTARRGGTARVRYRVADPAFSSASVTVTLAVVTARGVTALGTRVPAVQVGQAREWAFRCDLPPGSYTVVARAYDVAGHGQVSPSTRVLKVSGAAASPALARRR